MEGKDRYVIVPLTLASANAFVALRYPLAEARDPSHRAGTAWLLLRRKRDALGAGVSAGLWISFPEQLRRAEEDEALHTWELSQLLLQRSREVVSEFPRKALERTELAVVVSRHLSPAYDPGWVLDLRARAHAHLGNARRVVG